MIKVLRLRIDHGREFENSLYSYFCSANGIAHKFSTQRTAQQNGIEEGISKLFRRWPASFWMLVNCHNVSGWSGTYCSHTVNRIYLRPGTTKTPYELWKCKKPNLKDIHIFGTKCFILVYREQRGKIELKSDEGVFLGYSPNNRAFRVYNRKIQVILESVNVIVDDEPDESDSQTTSEDNTQSEADIIPKPADN